MWFSDVCGGTGPLKSGSNADSGVPLPESHLHGLRAGDSVTWILTRASNAADQDRLKNTLLEPAAGIAGLVVRASPGGESS